MLAEVHDIDRLSIRAVTARAGVSPSALYMHFADKDGLVAAIKQRCFTALRERVDVARELDGQTPRERLQAMGRAYLAFAREQPGWYAVCFQVRYGVAEEDTMPLDRESDDAGIHVFLDLMDVVAQQRRTTEEDAFEVATILWTALHGRASLVQAMPGCPLPDEDRWLARLYEGWVGSPPVGSA